MLPFLGQGDRGAERSVKLALIGQLFYKISTIFFWVPDVFG